MADYKRMVSYMYQYENGVKKKNVGYVRIESKNGQCKFTLHMQLLGQLDSIFPVYLIQRDSNGMNLIYVGDSALKNQIMDSKLSATDTNIMGSGHDLPEMGGMLLFLSERIFFATEWDDKPIAMEQVMKAMQPKPSMVKRPEEKRDAPGRGPANDKLFAGKLNGTGAYQTEHASSRGMYEPARGAKSPDEDIMPMTGADIYEELIPKYKLPRGMKIIERLQNPAVTDISQSPEELLKEEAERVAARLAASDYGQDTFGDTQTEGGTEYMEDITRLVNAADYAFAYAAEEEPTPDMGIPGTMRDPGIPGAETVRNTRMPGTETVQSDMGASETGIIQDEAGTETIEITETIAAAKTMEEIKATEETETVEDTEATEEAVTMEAEETEAMKEVWSDAFGEAGTKQEQPDPPMAVHFFENYPRIYPFEDNEITLCVKIEPKDIGYLTKEAWTLSNNSFLLHGFYSYQHLIFAKLKGRFGCRYILGVPGIFHNREKFMAKMFGFENFKSIRKRELHQGDFGYWFITIPM